MTTTEKIYNIIIAQLGIDQQLSGDLDLRGDLNISDEELDELFLTLEEEFSIETVKTERDPVITVRDLTNLIKDKIDDLEEE